MCFRIRSARYRSARYHGHHDRPWCSIASYPAVPGRRYPVFRILSALFCGMLISATTANAEDGTENDAALQAAALRSTIEVLEQGGDSWHPEIAEVILSLAGHVQSMGDHEEALALLERAVHLSRINHGLFSLQQVPGLRMQVDSHLAMNQWDEADGLQHYAFFVQSRSMGDNNPEMIPALEAFAEWSIEAFVGRRGDFPAVRLVDAYHLYSVALSIMDKNPEVDDIEKRQAYLQQLASLAWLMSRTGIQTRPESQFNDYRRVDDGWVDRVTEGRYRFRNNAFIQGESALRQIAELHRRGVETAVDEQSRRRSLRRQAESMLDVGDWHLLFERRQASNAVYQQAWTLLAEEDEAMRSAVFERVVLLPRFDPRFQLGPRRRPVSSTATALAGDNEDSEDVPAENRAVPYVVMAFDINQYGRARNVQVVESWPEDDTEMQRRLSTALRESRLRPAIRNGGPAISEGLVYRFPYAIERQVSVAQ